ncbi:MAG: hypothetical protein KA974_08065 [Saprospiraceae bacterium]|nr:hypothetical protein [Saprospiraceae bacterium]MBP7699350.1 hypothetical protein [Saprospiraceae bacterium]
MTTANGWLPLAVILQNALHDANGNQKIVQNTYPIGEQEISIQNLSDFVDGVLYYNVEIGNTNYSGTIVKTEQ